MKQKVFCIGFHKTGTSSLALALKTLGYRVAGAAGRHDPDIATNVRPMAYELAKNKMPSKTIHGLLSTRN